jgi:hypothetical protein
MRVGAAVAVEIDGHVVEIEIDVASKGEAHPIGPVDGVRADEPRLSRWIGDATRSRVGRDFLGLRRAQILDGSLFCADRGKGRGAGLGQAIPRIGDRPPRPRRPRAAIAVLGGAFGCCCEPPFGGVGVGLALFLVPATRAREQKAPQGDPMRPCGGAC